jgi:hypothetical protein
LVYVYLESFFVEMSVGSGSGQEEDGGTDLSRAFDPNV